VTTRSLPLFPLGMVLYPGVAVPLHLFEPRYRQMLRDVQAGDKRFGIICAIPGVDERALPPGRMGCVAEVTDAETLEDGRSNVLVVGRERFALDRFVDDAAPYHVGEVHVVHDDADVSPVALAVAGDEVASNFRRVVRAVLTLNDDASDLPPLPDDMTQLAYSVASMIDVELSERQALLEERSPLARLQRIDTVLRTALPDLELKAAMHKARRDEA
jgi:Lon protease-like protein